MTSELEKQWMKKGRMELIQTCKDYGLDSKGTKNMLVSRILKHLEENKNEEITASIEKSEAELPIELPIELLHTCRHWLVSRVAISDSSKGLKATDKWHRFNPKVSLQEAFEYCAKTNQFISIEFENKSTLSVVDGVVQSFYNAEEEEEKSVSRKAQSGQRERSDSNSKSSGSRNSNSSEGWGIPAVVSGQIEGVQVVQGSVLKGARLNATSKFHRFTPPASLHAALSWLKDQQARAASLVLENKAMLMFVDGKFEDFDSGKDV